VIAFETLPLFEEEAKKRQATSTGGKYPKLKTQLSQKFDQAVKGKSAEQGRSKDFKNDTSVPFENGQWG